MSVHRELSKVFAATTRKCAVPLTYTREELTPFQAFCRRTIWPAFMKFYKAPIERWDNAFLTRYMRERGMMYDDHMRPQEPIVERALELLPPDLMQARYRRLMRVAFVEWTKTHLPYEMQNYDPYIPYMAPYIEEAKFQIQEEEELLGFHPWDRKLWKGGVTGLGDFTDGGQISNIGANRILMHGHPEYHDMGERR
ncbi:unnamed protein product [Vitrella brassicaformis CCMP3155]|uniref:Uncharacterized protein n=1 Tax=Vitrella brassicaformis (strain CCMP3155) TaxID=1169540 RepID=A0A0G4ECN4_VITBC|nr:unnamed protein product [Vitrella brassicaformis CCMP3155]|eukprot:CEL93734.1 unnamed protein product [Vitrella brassicaformis CCMP3155]